MFYNESGCLDKNKFTFAYMAVFPYSDHCTYIIRVLLEFYCCKNC